MPPPTPREVHVRVVLDPPGGSPPDRPPFHFETTDLPMGPDNFLIFRNCNHPGFLVHFDLDDTNNPGYRFPESSLFPPNPPKQNLRAALFCAAQPPCPIVPSNWGQFEADGVINGGRTLVVLNKNDTPHNFWYTLRVTKDAGQSYGYLDPGGSNENGGISRLDSSFTTTLFVGAAITGVLSSIATTVALARLDLL